MEVCAPPECDTVTPGATSSDDAEPAAVVPGAVVPAAVVSPDELEPDAPEPVAVPVASAVPVGCPVAGPLPVFPVVSVSLALAVPLCVELVVPPVSGLAQATPAGVAMAVPTPSATASAPTRPTKSLYCIVYDPHVLSKGPHAVTKAMACGVMCGKALTSSSVYRVVTVATGVFRHFAEAAFHGLSRTSPHD